MLPLRSLLRCSVLVGLFFVLILSGCDDDGDDRGIDGEPMGVTIQGIFDDGTTTSPIGNAPCRFVDQNGMSLATTTSASDGSFSLQEVPPDVQGFIRCAPSTMRRLTLAAFVSTEGRAVGEIIVGENVSPASNIVAQLVARTAAADQQSRKATLTSTPATAQAS